MRKFVLFAPALLAACAANSAAPSNIPPPSEQSASDSPAPADAMPVHGVTPGHKCEISGTEQFIGKTGTSQTGDAIKHASHAAVLRWAPPGYAMTMDYREDRVTVYLDQAGKITKINCG